MWKGVCWGVLGIFIVVSYAKFFEYLQSVYEWINFYSDNLPLLISIIHVGHAVLPVFLLSSAVFVWVSGSVFGYVKGMALAISGTAVGMAVPFLLCRYLLSEFLLKRSSYLRSVARWKTLSHLDGWGMFLLRLSPMPYQILNYAAALSPLSFTTYMVASVLGQMPSNYTGIHVGVSINDISALLRGERPPSTSWALSFVVSTAACILLPLVLRRRLQSNIPSDDDVEGNEKIKTKERNEKMSEKEKAT
eukprot:Rmarinus@m.14767